MSETFIKIDSLQHLEISRETYPSKRPKIRVTTCIHCFDVMLVFSKLMPIIQTSVASIL